MRGPALPPAYRESAGHASIQRLRARRARLSRLDVVLSSLRSAGSHRADLRISGRAHPAIQLYASLQRRDTSLAPWDLSGSAAVCEACRPMGKWGPAKNNYHNFKFLCGRNDAAWNCPGATDAGGEY